VRVLAILTLTCCMSFFRALVIMRSLRCT
jgi:hypothetical protein